MRPATRSRLRPWLLLTLLILTAVYLTTGSRSTSTSAYYRNTVAALDARRKAASEGTASGEERHAFQAQTAAEAKVRDGQGGEIRLEAVPDHEGGKGEQVSHRQKPLGDENEGGKKKGKKQKALDEEEAADAVHGPVEPEEKTGKKKVLGKTDGDDGVAKVGNTGKKAEGKEEKVESEEDHEVEVLLNGILKKSPIIIFSKTYCPYSKKAKHILLEEYKIVPAPYVHEVDIMEDKDLASRLQDKLFEMTKRRTVPNVLINGVSIGGGDDVSALDESDTLIEKIKDIGGKRIVEVTKATKDRGVKFRA